MSDQPPSAVIDRIAAGQYEPEELFRRLLAVMAETIERLNPPDGPFEPVVYDLRFKGRAGGLEFGASPDKPPVRYVRLSIRTASGISASSVWLDFGTNAELVRYLGRPDVVADAVRLADEAIISLARNDLA